MNDAELFVMGQLRDDVQLVLEDGQVVCSGGGVCRVKIQRAQVPYSPDTTTEAYGGRHGFFGREVPGPGRPMEGVVYVGEWARWSAPWEGTSAQVG
jgi:hypothetical protein